MGKKNVDFFLRFEFRSSVWLLWLLLGCQLFNKSWAALGYSVCIRHSSLLRSREAVKRTKLLMRAAPHCPIVQARETTSPITPSTSRARPAPPPSLWSPPLRHPASRRPPPPHRAASAPRPFLSASPDNSALRPPCLPTCGKS